MPASEGELTLGEALEEAQAGILDDRLDRFLPLDLYGPPTAAELATAAQDRAKTANAVPANERDRRNGPAGRTFTHRRR
jgi:hypothetical protein